MASVSLSLAPGSQVAKPRPVGHEDAFSRPYLIKVGAFWAAHIALAIAMRAEPTLATVHALLCAVIGIAYALTTRKLSRIAPVAAYIAGSEVLWRMNHANVFWEFGKYAVIAMLGTALLRSKWPRNRALALAYIGLLLPSALLTIGSVPLEEARQLLSFHLAGPFALSVAVLYFSNVRATGKQFLATLAALIAPVLGIATIVLIRSSASAQLEFVNAANFATSGGFGPNQVSAMLGLAMMCLLLIVAVERGAPWLIRIPLFALAAILGAQAALTFARGGLVLALAGMTSAAFVLLRGNARARITVGIVALVATLVGRYVIEPRLDEFTGGRLSERYSNTKTSGRDAFVRSEFELFADYPVLGVGPGIAKIKREERGGFQGASHTEYTRTLAEHGILGALALACLFTLAVRCVLTTKDRTARAIALALVTWALLFWLVYGTRIVAPSFVFGLAFLRRLQPP